MEYGGHPSAATATKLKYHTGTTLTLGTAYSNDFFTQLLVANMTQSERMFYAPSRASVKPDELFGNDATALAHGECGFAYIAGISRTDPPNTPLAFGPVSPGTRHLDPKANNGKCAILRIDDSVMQADLDAAGNIIINGMDLLDPRQPFWYGRKPDVKWPK